MRQPGWRWRWRRWRWRLPELGGAGPSSEASRGGSGPSASSQTFLSPPLPQAGCCRRGEARLLLTRRPNVSQGEEWRRGFVLGTISHGESAPTRGAGRPPPFRSRTGGRWREESEQAAAPPASPFHQSPFSRRIPAVDWPGHGSPPPSIPKSGSFEQSPCVVSERRRRRFLLLPRLLHLCGCCCRKETGRAGLGSGAGAAPQ